MQAWIRAVDAYYALGRHRDAADVARRAMQQCPEFQTLPQFKVRERTHTAAGRTRTGERQQHSARSYDLPQFEARCARCACCAYRALPAGCTQT